MNALSHFGFLRNFRRTAAARPTLRTLLSVAKERHALKSLPADRLEDIGYSASEAKAEADRPVWDVPRHWTR